MDFYSKVLPQVRRLPGVTNAAFISYLPMVTGGGIQIVNGLEEQRASLRFVSPDFFAAMGIAVQMGRDVSEADTLDAPLSAVVSESFARRYLPGRDPIGHGFDFVDAHRRIVGVVGDIRVRGLERESEPQVYLPYKQMPLAGRAAYMPRELVVRSAIRPDSLIPLIRRIILANDPDLPLEVRMLEDIVTEQTGTRAAQVRVIGLFAALSLLLAGLGVHGLLSYAVSQRIPEIGVRIALGARSKDILRIVVREAVLLASLGCALGLVLGYVSGRSIEALLAGVRPNDIPTFVAAMILALMMTVSGSLIPALRAIRVNPMTVIRME
jgi:predicted permease